MRKILILGLLFGFIFTSMSCGGHTGPNPTDNVTWGKALGIALTMSSYIWTLVIAVVVSLVLLYLLNKHVAVKGYDGLALGMIFVIAALLFCSFMALPSAIAADTTNEMAARGHYMIGG